MVKGTVRKPCNAQVMIDDCDRWLLERFQWKLTSRGYVARCIDNCGRLEFLHRVISQPRADQVVDHINGIKMDNRRCNLRNVTQCENTQNRSRLNKNNTSGYRGVTFNKFAGKWRAECKIGRKGHAIGYFDTAEEANDAVIAYRLQNMSGALG